MKRFCESKWISDGNSMGDESHLLRRNFVITKQVKRAMIYCCGLGQAEYFVNAQKVGDEVLVTQFTAYDKRVLYNCFDITYLVKIGENAIVAHLGNGFYNDQNSTWNFDKATWRSHPKLIAELVITYTDNSCDVICSDSKWEACMGPVTFNRMRSGEFFDARLLPHSWNDVTYNKNEWHQATICRGAGGILSENNNLPIRIIKTIAPKKISGNLYDFGMNLSGWVRIRVKGNSGDAVTMRYYEYINPDGNPNMGNGQFIQSEHKHIGQYILRGNGTEEYAPAFVYYGFRYVEIETDAELEYVKAELVHTDMNRIGDFSCNDEMLNSIHAACKLSILTNYVGIPTDCPHREQNGWTGDAGISALQTLMNFDVKQAYQKWLLDFKDAQRANGQLPGIIPTSSWDFDFYNGPAWDSAVITIPWDVYKITGDKTFIEQMWENMTRYMDFLYTMTDDYTIAFGLGDWCPPDSGPPWGEIKCPNRVTDTAYYYMDAKIMSECCRILNKEDIYSELAKKIKEAWRKRYLNNAKLEESQTFLACAIYYDLYNRDEQPKAAKKLADLVIKNDYHIDCGILGTKCIFTALSEYGYIDVLYKMVTNPTAPSYAYWINNNMTTLCEHWFCFEEGNRNDASKNHHMFSTVDFWLYKYVAGMEINESGLVIHPRFIKGLDWVKAYHKGISVFWNDSSVKVELPYRAKVIIDDICYEADAGTHTFIRQNKI